MNMIPDPPVRSRNEKKLKSETYVRRTYHDTHSSNYGYAATEQMRWATSTVCQRMGDPRRHDPDRQRQQNSRFLAVESRLSFAAKTPREITTLPFLTNGGHHGDRVAALTHVDGGQPGPQIAQNSASVGNETIEIYPL